jgi:hypothetical protein
MPVIGSAGEKRIARSAPLGCEFDVVSVCSNRTTLYRALGLGADGRAGQERAGSTGEIARR